MAEGFGRWESDPLFPAAECVQDSADRYGDFSIFPLLLIFLYVLLAGILRVARSLISRALLPHCGEGEFGAGYKYAVLVPELGILSL
jgi:hypothetical protein